MHFVIRQRCLRLFRPWYPSNMITLFQLLRRLYTDPRSPGMAKMLPIAALLYAFLPFDLVADLVPILGQIDDIGIIALLLWLALRHVPRTPPPPSTRGGHPVIDVPSNGA